MVDFTKYSRTRRILQPGAERCTSIQLYSFKLYHVRCTMRAAWAGPVRACVHACGERRAACVLAPRAGPAAQWVGPS
eukprot:SAG25_NODE_329_length_9697_cov_22.376120_4_plen_77_part_00